MSTDVPIGWRGILATLRVELRALGWRGTIDRARRVGYRLRIDLSDYGKGVQRERVLERVRAAEDRAAIVCDTCGGPVITHGVVGGWERGCCEPCWRKAESERVVDHG